MYMYSLYNTIAMINSIHVNTPVKPEASNDN